MFRISREPAHRPEPAPDSYRSIRESFDPVLLRRPFTVTAHVGEVGEHLLRPAVHDDGPRCDRHDSPLLARAVWQGTRLDRHASTLHDERVVGISTGASQIRGPVRAWGSTG